MRWLCVGPRKRRKSGEESKPAKHARRLSFCVAEWMSGLC